MELVAIDVSSGHVARLTNHSQCHGSWQVVDVCQDDILAVVSAPNRPPALLLGIIPAKGQEDKMVWTRLDNCSIIEKRKKSFELQLAARWLPTRGAVLISETPYEGVLMMPNEGESLPLVVCPHGGPHGVSVAGWPRRSVTSLINSGFAFLYVNYHGSLGFGDKFVRSLPGKCGNLDVKECYTELQTLLRLLSSKDFTAQVTSAHRK
ncbi:hypothetical protein COOONC_05444 [Cooperia oncophora]